MGASRGRRRVACKSSATVRPLVARMASRTAARSVSTSSCASRGRANSLPCVSARRTRRGFVLGFLCIWYRQAFRPGASVVTWSCVGSPLQRGRRKWQCAFLDAGLKLGSLLGRLQSVGKTDLVCLIEGIFRGDVPGVQRLLEIGQWISGRFSIERLGFGLGRLRFPFGALPLGFRKGALLRVEFGALPVHRFAFLSNPCLFRLPDFTGFPFGALLFLALDAEFGFLPFPFGLQPGVLGLAGCGGDARLFRLAGCFRFPQPRQFFPFRLQPRFLRLPFRLQARLFFLIRHPFQQHGVQRGAGLVQGRYRVRHKFFEVGGRQFQRLNLCPLGANRGGGLVRHGADSIANPADTGGDGGDAGGFGAGLGGFFCFPALLLGLDLLINRLLDLEQFGGDALRLVVDQVAAFQGWGLDLLAQGFQRGAITANLGARFFRQGHAFGGRHVKRSGVTAPQFGQGGGGGAVLNDLVGLGHLISTRPFARAPRWLLGVALDRRFNAGEKTSGVIDAAVVVRHFADAAPACMSRCQFEQAPLTIPPKRIAGASGLSCCLHRRPQCTVAPGNA